MRDRQDGRLDLVRQMLSGTALKWMNRRVQELNEKVSTCEFSGSVEWDVLRQPFIDAHLGLNTIETFKAELRTLRLGSDECPTPSELNKRFDHVAELAYPDRMTSSMASVLGDEYRSIIAASAPFLYKNVERSSAPQTLDEWKKAVARHWAAELNIKATLAQLPSTRTAGQQRGRGGVGRGGTSWRGRGSDTSSTQSQQQSVNAIGTRAEGSEDRGVQGEDYTVEGENDDQQLMGISGGRGGRGGRGGQRGGRGGGSGGSRMPVGLTAEQKKLVQEGKCFLCKQLGHFQWACPKLQETRGQQSNE